MGSDLELVDRKEGTVPLWVSHHTLSLYNLLSIFIVAVPIIGFPLMNLVGFLNELSPSLFLTTSFIALLFASLLFRRLVRVRNTQPLTALKEASPVAWARVSQWMTALNLQIEVFAWEGKVARVFERNLLLPRELVKRIEEVEDRTGEAVILHELAHVFNHDNMKIILLLFFGWSLPVVSVLLLTIPIIMALDAALGYDFIRQILGNSHQDYLSTYYSLTARELSSELLSIYTGEWFLVYINSLGMYSVLLLLLRQLVRRLSEFLADIFAVSAQKNSIFLCRALVRTEVEQHLNVASSQEKLQDYQATLAFYKTYHKDNRWSNLLGWKQKAHIPLSFSLPTARERLFALNDPRKTLDTHERGFVVGLLMAFVLYFCSVVGIWSAVFLVIVGYFSLASYSVAWAIKTDSLSHMIEAILKNALCTLLGIGVGILLIGTGFVLSGGIRAVIGKTLASEPNSLGTLLSALETYARLSFHLVPLAIFVLVLLVLLLIGNAVASRELMTWYDCPFLQKTPGRTMYTLSVAVVYPFLASAFGICALSTLEGYTLYFTLGCCGPFMLLLIGWPFILLPLLAHRYRRRCPNCDESIPGFYYLGRKCKQCQYELNRWLFRAVVTSAKSRVLG